MPVLALALRHRLELSDAPVRLHASLALRVDLARSPVFRNRAALLHRMQVTASLLQRRLAVLLGLHQPLLQLGHLAHFVVQTCRRDGVRASLHLQILPQLIQLGAQALACRHGTLRLRRRLVPVRSRIIATAPLSDNLMRQLMPKRMMLSETRKLHYYYRPSPDGRRILFGGRDGTIAGDPTWPTDHLRRALIDIFPEVEDVQLTHSWFGHVAMNRDMIPRIFSRQGVRYAAGYCGSGVVWARWAGQKAALQVLGEDGGKSALDMRPPGAVPLYNGTPWFMPGVFAWLTWQDRRAHRHRKGGTMNAKRGQA